MWRKGRIDVCSCTRIMSMSITHFSPWPSGTLPFSSFFCMTYEHTYEQTKPPKNNRKHLTQWSHLAISLQSSIVRLLWLLGISLLTFWHHRNSRASASEQVLCMWFNLKFLELCHMWPQVMQWASAWSSIFQWTSKSSIQWGGLKQLVSTTYYWKVTHVYQSHISNEVAVPVPFSNLFQLMQSWKRKPTLGSCTRSPECRKYSDVLLSWSKKIKLTRKTNQNNFSSSVDKWYMHI